MLQQSLSNQFSTKISWFWLAAIAVIWGSYGWMLAPYSSLLALMGTISIALAVALVRACYQAGFPVWAGLWSLTFGTVFIAVGTLTSIGALGWASAILALGAGIFLLEIALRKIVAVMSLFDLEPTPISLILAIVAVESIMSGWIAHMIMI